MAATESTTATMANTAATDQDLFQTLGEFHAYKFTKDPEFRIGLATLLKKNAPELTEEDLNRNDEFLTKAKLFYFSRKRKISPPLSLPMYYAFLESSVDIMDHASGAGTSETTQPTEPAVKPEEESAKSSTANLEKPAERNEDASTIQHPFAGPAETATKPEGVIEMSAAATAPAPAPESTEQPAYPSSFAHIVELITTGQPIPGIQEIPDTVLKGKETKASASRRTKPWEQNSGGNGNGESPDKVLDLSHVIPSVYANPVNEVTIKEKDEGDVESAIDVEKDGEKKAEAESESSPDDKNETAIAQ